MRCRVMPCACHDDVDYDAVMMLPILLAATRADAIDTLLIFRFFFSLIH